MSSAMAAEAVFFALHSASQVRIALHDVINYSAHSVVLWSPEGCKCQLFARLFLNEPVRCERNAAICLCGAGIVVCATYALFKHS